jgi:hypothetical protein
MHEQNDIHGTAVISTVDALPDRGALGRADAGRGKLAFQKCFYL